MNISSLLYIFPSQHITYLHDYNELKDNFNSPCTNDNNDDDVDDLI